jgi:lipopolysaccharide export system protein LptA
MAQGAGGADSLVRLVEAESAHLIEVDGVALRKVIGPATFLHNNTYLKCDTALWNVNTNIIDAIGNVEILQENTSLTSDRIEYVANDNLAKFRGALVQLFDREGNVLKTNYLDYNTKDSIATFFNGASLKSSDNKVIESINGMYYSKENLFTFMDQVQMFADSVFISTTELEYYTQTDVAVFKKMTTGWKDSSMLYANQGRYHRRLELFELDKDAYIMDPTHELWADRLLYYRNTGDADLYSNVQILDTVQSSIAMADKIVYRPSLKRIELMDSPVAAMYSVENGVADTLFLAADSIIFHVERMCDVDSAQIAHAKERLQLSGTDPIAIHDKQRREAKKSKHSQGDKTLSGKDVRGEGLKKDDSNEGALERGTKKGMLNSDGEIAGIPLAAQDTIMPVAADTLAGTLLRDTSDVNFIDAFHNVKFYRSDVQGKCDSLVFTGIDSMARFYSNPVMWQDGKNQFSADSIQALIKSNSLNKINLITNAFIIAQEDSVHFNQIKSTEMAAYFKDNELYRFDALGGVTALFYMMEDSVITLMDREECRMMSVKLKNNEVQRVRSIEDLKQNVYPVYNLPDEEQKLKGFNWRGEERPLTRWEITKRKVRKSCREEIAGIRMPDYSFTKKYFPELADEILELQKGLVK